MNANEIEALDEEWPNRIGQAGDASKVLCILASGDDGLNGIKLNVLKILLEQSDVEKQRQVMEILVGMTEPDPRSRPERERDLYQTKSIRDVVGATLWSLAPPARHTFLYNLARVKTARRTE